MPAAAYFTTLAHYNRWMNKRIYELCTQIPDTQRKKDLNAFFHSIHGTLNHLLLGDRIWLGRFKHTPFLCQSLNQELYSDFATLHQERTQTDSEILEWVNSLTDMALTARFSFNGVTTGQERTYQLGHLILHFFNHQTHHRGQVTTLITQSGYDIGVTDLLWLPDLALTNP